MSASHTIKLNLKTPFASIQELNEFELPDFTVLTGLNGSGKTQLLQGIQSGKIEVEGYDLGHIISFNASNFQLGDQNTSAINPRNRGLHLSDFKEEIRASMFDGPTSFREKAAEIRTEFFNSYKHSAEVCRKSGKSLWDLQLSDLPNEVYVGISSYRDKVEDLIRTERETKSAIKSSILAAAKRLPVGIDEVSEEEFFEVYSPIVLQNDFLVSGIGAIFADYYSKIEDNSYNAHRNNTRGEDRPVYSDQEFVSKFGPKPWDVLNQIIGQVGGFQYSVNNPEGLDRDDTFQLELLDATKPYVSLNFSDLSSGERVLMALINVVYRASSDGLFDGILLLDEIDASLHPSVLRTLFWVIEECLLKAGMKVIMVTHSPTAVALAPPEAVHIMKRDGADRVAKCSQETALDTLTEGFVTLERGMKIFDSLSPSEVVVVTEGKNTKLIKAALNHWEISGVEVMTGVETRSGIPQLKTLFDFFQLVSHDSKVVFVWDCDAILHKNVEALSAGNDTYPFLFEKNPMNKLTPKGIENLFAEELFEGFCKTYWDKGEEKQTFDENRKNDFADFILGRDRKEDFKLFEGLMQRLIEIKT